MSNDQLNSMKEELEWRKAVVEDLKDLRNDQRTHGLFAFTMILILLGLIACLAIKVMV